MRTKDNNSGMVLVAVVCFTALAAILAASVLSDGMTQIRLVRRQVRMEQAFYLAEGGAEQAVAYIRNGSAMPGVVTGSFSFADNTTGRFTAVVVEAFDTAGGGGSASNSMAGSINLNPNNSPDNEFLLVKPDGATITRDDLQNDTTSYTSAPCVYYTGPAVMIRVKPKGNGNQNSLIVNGAVYPLLNANTYDLVSLNMNVQVFNTSRNSGNGRANGQWWLGNIAGDDVTIGAQAAAGPGPAARQFTIFSTGRIADTRRAVILEGVQQQAWARYALWYNNAAGPIWIGGGEVFNGPVHANTMIYLDGNPIFNALLSSTASTWGSGSDLAQVQFNAGTWLNAPADTMASVVFTNLSAAATLTVSGLTYMTMSGTNLFITNSRKGWNNHRVATPSNGLIYVDTASSGGNRNAIVYLGGQLDGRLTIAAEDSIRITNHLTYAVHPTNGSDDALGLIAQKDVEIRANAPANLNIFAHIIACNPDTSTYESGFFVQNYNTRWGCGLLNVYGGIVENNRGAVGTTGGNGYTKNYTYDQRFQTAPPPNYPSVLNIYQWNNWREKAL